jgi:hypothetical protein
MYLSSQREKRTNDGRFDHKTLGHWADLDVVLLDISIFFRQNAEGPTQTKTLVLIITPYPIGEGGGILLLLCPVCSSVCPGDFPVLKTAGRILTIFGEKVFSMLT